MISESDQIVVQRSARSGRRSFLGPRQHGAGAAERTAWQRSYVRRTVVLDACAAVVGAGAGFLVRFGPDGSPSDSNVASIWMAAVLPVVWVLAMLLSRSYERRFLWVGAEEFRRVFGAAVLILAAVATVSWAFKLEVARGFVVVALPLATALTLLLRYAHRSWLHRQRGRGRFQQTMLIVGHRSGIEALHTQIVRAAYHGFRVVGCCLPDDQRGQPTMFDGIPVLGWLDNVADVVRHHDVDTVAVLPSRDLDGPALRQLGWDLEETPAELLLAPSVTEIVGTRVNIRPVCGLPLLHMERPELRGVRRFAKATLDRVLATLAVVVLLPVLVAIAVAVKVTSRGTVLFRQVRVGRDGKLFSMLKFRSMVDGADRMPVLRGAHDGNGVLFKLREDPRATPVGRFIRRYSLDELPQMFNVLRGEMSLVGPRPPLPSEVERYGYDMHRRFLVKPGLTGLWQISGRSDLSWEESVRIDVRYVENWSLAFDFMILWKTVGAVLRGPGAY
jgi:exopolysaccharide biosynthesis polyprenyl glycosylphosphotransferase